MMTLVTPVPFEEAPDAEATLVYVPGFGDNVVSTERRQVLRSWARAAGARGLALLRAQTREISMLTTANRVEEVLAASREWLKETNTSLIFLANSFGSAMALQLAEDFSERTKGVLLITPAVGNFEHVTKRVLMKAMNCDEVRAERIWGRFDTTNRQQLSLEGRDLSETYQFYLDSDIIIESPALLRPKQRRLMDDKATHFDWERAELLAQAVRERLQGLE